MLESVTLADIWFLLLAVLLFLYVWTDGFDLGVGMLLALTRDEEYRGTMVHSIESVWHANQTWLVIAGGVLFGAFPGVYGSVLTPLYIPVSALLFSFMLRGVALEYRAEATNKPLVGWLLALGSFMTTICLGLILAGVVQGIPLRNGEFSGNVMDWLTPFSLILAVTLVFAFLLLGGCWLLLKTQGLLRGFVLVWTKASAWGSVLCLAVTLTFITLTSGMKHLSSGLFTPLPMLLLILAIASLVLLFWRLRMDNDNPTLQPLIYTGLTVLFSMCSFAMALYPNIVPPSLTLEQAASPPEMLEIMLKVVGTLLPLLILYNLYQYRVFRSNTGEAQED